MSCLSAQQISEKRADLLRWETHLSNLDTAFAGGLVEAGGIRQYRFDSGEGSQQVSYYKPNEMMDSIRFAEGRVNRLRRELRGSGVITANMRRRH